MRVVATPLTGVRVIRAVGLDPAVIINDSILLRIAFLVGTVRSPSQLVAS
jgi:hypothetical protein